MLRDLEELVLECRDERAQAYIREAVACYRSGAYRAAIVSTWIAVAFDIIDKFRELALAGDKEAERLTGELDGIRRSNDIVRSLAFERTLLDVARDKFELLSPLEHLDLQRLQEDRNRCAHPSRTSDTEIFSPSAELARLHIRAAVEHLLKHEPAQGKSALDALLKDISSAYFPTNRKDALAILAQGPLNKARNSLVRNLTVVIIKSSLADEKVDYKQRLRYRATLQCIGEIHPDTWRKTLRDDLTKLYRPLSSDTELSAGIRLLSVDDELWGSLDEGQRTKLRTFVENLPSPLVDELDVMLANAGLKHSAELRIQRLTIQDMGQALFFDLPPQIADYIVRRYAASRSFDDANAWAKHIQMYAADLSSDNVRDIVIAAGANGEISGSFQLPNVIAALRRHVVVPPAELSILLRDNGLEKYVSAAATSP